MLTQTTPSKHFMCKSYLPLMPDGAGVSSVVETLTAGSAESSTLLSSISSLHPSLGSQSSQGHPAHRPPPALHDTQAHLIVSPWTQKLGSLSPSWWVSAVPALRARGRGSPAQPQGAEFPPPTPNIPSGQDLGKRFISFITC